MVYEWENTYFQKRLTVPLCIQKGIKHNENGIKESNELLLTDLFTTPNFLGHS